MTRLTDTSGRLSLEVQVSFRVFRLLAIIGLTPQRANWCPQGFHEVLLPSELKVPNSRSRSEKERMKNLRIRALSSPAFFTNHKFDIRTLVRLAQFSSFSFSFLLCPETFTSNNLNRALSLSSNNKPLLRVRLPSITQRDSQKKNLKNYIGLLLSLVCI
jgi:hypothetical protein